MDLENSTQYVLNIVNLLKPFNSTLSDIMSEHRLLHAMKQCEKQRLVPPTTIIDKKCPNRSEKLCEESDIIFQNSTSETELLEACEISSKSIAFAPKNSPELPKAFANKSAILFQLEKYEDCLTAIDHCLKLNCADSIKSTLLLRKIKCLAILKSDKLQNVYQETLNWIEEKIPTENQNELKVMLDECVQTEVVLNSKNEPLNMEVHFQEFGYSRTNDEMPSSSNFVALKYNKTYGRHLVATVDIRPGQIIVKEKPYLLILKTPKRYSHCWRCTDVAWNCVPCDHCTNVIFCSEECKNEAWTKFHDIECECLSEFLKMIDPKLMDYHLAGLRLTILALKECGGIQNLREELRSVNEATVPRTKGFSVDGKLYSDKYRSVYSLATPHFKNMHRQLHMITIISTLIIYNMATKSKFFGTKFKDWQQLLGNGNVIFIGGLIIRNTAIYYLNCLNQNIVDPHNVNKSGAILPVMSFLNHSCVANASRTFDKNYNFLYACYPIRKGDQIFIDYVPYVNQEVRKTTLFTKYGVTCKCQRCRAIWPEWPRLPLLKSVAAHSQYKDTLMAEMAKIQPYMLMTKENFTEKVKNSKEHTAILRQLRDSLEIILKFSYMPSAEVMGAVYLIDIIYSLIYD